MNKNRENFSKRRLERHILALCLLVKDMCPDAEIEIHVPGFGGLDAWLDVVVNDDKVLDIDEALSQRAFEIYMEEGYEIGMNVIERSVGDPLKVKA
ncbi:MAG: hypothetical protein HY709_11020 [Candidatus Latescibacteria bacterium]|nr:hypothetical protein [Candidatus Latescibacterota bacterium]